MARDGRRRAGTRLPDGPVSRLSGPFLLAAAGWAALLWWLSSRPLPVDTPAGSDKLAHLVAYAVLAALARLGIGPRRGSALAAFALAAAYGVVDEIHQSWVPGRFASVADGLADAMGACVGAWFAGRFFARRASLADGRRR